MRSKPTLLRHYFVSCGLLLVPIFAWNAVLASQLPAPWSTSEFWHDIPGPLAWVENASRVLVSALPFLMPLERTLPIQRRGLIVFGTGLALYCASWLAILFAPDSRWAVSPAGFLAPAYTPFAWLVGLAMVGQRLFWGCCYRWWMYLIAAGIFVIAHVGHALIVFERHAMQAPTG